MRSRLELWLGRAGSLALAASVLVSGTSAFAQQLREEFRRAVVATESEGQAGEQFWIGVACGPLTESLRTQLGLPEGQGVVVNDVMAESPAAKAGLERYDVILVAGEKTIGSPQDLMEAVRQVKEGELQVQLIRTGKPLTLVVQPARRPPQAVPPAPPAGFPGSGNSGELQEYIQRWMQGMPPQGQPGMRFRMLRPGMVLPPGMPFEMTLPDDLTVTITRHGKDPAKVSVQKGSTTWDLTEQTLQELPDDIRPFVERMLGRPMMGFGFPGGGPPPVRVEIEEGEGGPVPGPGPGQPVPPWPPRFRAEGADIDQRFDELSRQIRELREAIEKLQKQDK